MKVFESKGFPLHALLNKAASFQRRLKTPARSPEGFELSVATNHLGHFLLSRLLVPLLTQTQTSEQEFNPNFQSRLVTLGTVTANSEEFGGKLASMARLKKQHARLCLAQPAP